MIDEIDNDSSTAKVCDVINACVRALNRAESTATPGNRPSDKIAAEMEQTVVAYEKVGCDIRRCDVAKWARQLRALA